MDNQHRVPPNVTTLVFVHVPKCGGTSFEAVVQQMRSRNHVWFGATGSHPGCGKYSHCSVSELARCFDEGRALICRAQPDWRSNSSECARQLLARRDEVGLPFGSWQRPPILMPRYVTMVRDPVERTVSEWFWFGQRHLLSWKTCTQVWTAAVCELTGGERHHNVSALLRWMAAPGNTAGNRQTQMLSDVRWAFGAAADRPCATMSASFIHLYSWRRYLVGDAAPGHVSTSPIAPINPTRTGPCSAAVRAQLVASHGHPKHGSWLWGQSCAHAAVQRAINEDEALLANAERTLQSDFFFVGVFEHFRVSLALLAKRLGLPGVPDVAYSRERAHHATPTGFIEHMGDEARLALEQMNRLDVRLHRGATERFAQMRRESP